MIRPRPSSGSVTSVINICSFETVSYTYTSAYGWRRKEPRTFRNACEFKSGFLAFGPYPFHVPMPLTCQPWHKASRTQIMKSTGADLNEKSPRLMLFINLEWRGFENTCFHVPTLQISFREFSQGYFIYIYMILKDKFRCWNLNFDLKNSSCCNENWQEWHNWHHLTSSYTLTESRNKSTLQVQV